MTSAAPDDAGPATVHIPQRPAWTCAGCQKPWPCPPRRDQLIIEYAADILPLALYLAACLVDAAYDLPDTPAGDLYQRFLGWLRHWNTRNGTGSGRA